MNKKSINKKENKDKSRKTKINVLKAIYTLVLTSGCELWVLTKKAKEQNTSSGNEVSEGLKKDTYKVWKIQSRLRGLHHSRRSKIK
ncbi:hypothetical protein NQ318_023476, partial [Aromia moschata]